MSALPNTHRPALRAATKAWRAGLTLGALGFAALAIVLVRLAEVWHVTPTARAHHVTVLGARLSYPTADAAAFVVLALALLGFVVSAVALVVASRESIGALRLHRALKQAVQIQRHDAFVIDDGVPRAFCAGWFRPQVFVTRAAVEALDEPALEAVLAHERGHAERRDPLRFAVARVMSASLFFVPAVKSLADEQRMLAELSADERALDGHGGPALARAMLAFEVESSRVDHVLGTGEGWTIPAMMCVLTAGAIASVVGIVMSLAAAAHGVTTLAPPFISREPCVLVLAAVTAVTLVLGSLVVRRRRRSA